MLSPANLGGVRGRRILDGRSEAGFMGTLVRGTTVPLGDVFAHISSLYYRGKRAYGRAFGRRPGKGATTFVITPTRGLVPDDEPVCLDDLREFASVDIDVREVAYLTPLTESARRLDQDVGPRGEVVLLGSIASDKYVEPLGRILGVRLRFPRAFIGRGDMSRGGLLLRCASAGEELEYVPALTAPRRGERPPRLPAPERPTSARAPT